MGNWIKGKSLGNHLSFLTKTYENYIYNSISNSLRFYDVKNPKKYQDKAKAYLFNIWY